MCDLDIFRFNQFCKLLNNHYWKKDHIWENGMSKRNGILIMSERIGIIVYMIKIDHSDCGVRKEWVCVTIDEDVWRGLAVFLPILDFPSSYFVRCSTWCTILLLVELEKNVCLLLMVKLQENKIHCFNTQICCKLHVLKHVLNWIQ